MHAKNRVVSKSKIGQKNISAANGTDGLGKSREQQNKNTKGFQKDLRILVPDCKIYRFLNHDRYILD